MTSNSPQRTIKFRGKFKDGKWEYGGIRFGDMGQAYILPHGATHGVELVNRDTVGQFTGLLDRTGKEIYEGDIVEVEGGVGVIEWDEHDLAWTLQNTEMPLTRSLSAKIIGNIYENELLNPLTHEFHD